MASKFKIKLKITGFELELEGTRDEVAELTQSVGQQMSSLLAPGGAIIEGSAVAFQPAVSDNTPRLQDRRPRRKRSPSAAPSTDDAGHAVDFRHDSSAYGMPRQEWKTAQKAMWLIHVLSGVNGTDSFSTRTLVETFNKHFKQSGTITTSNVTRDLGRSKVENPSLVGEDASQTPSVWFMTAEGTKRVSMLISESAAK